MKFLSILFLVFCISLCCSSYTALAQEVTAVVDAQGAVKLTWNHNTEADLDGYKLHVGQSAGVYDVVIDVEKTVNVYTVKGLTVGETYYFALTAYDTSKNESAYSVEVLGDAVDIVSPKQPTGLSTVTVNINININTQGG